MKRIVMRYIGYLLDIVIPPDPDIRAIEDLSAAEFAEKACRVKGLSLFSYKNPLVQKALVELKERPNRKIASMLGQLLYERLRDELPARAFPYLIVPIPITRKKRRERGWNQCELILKGLEKADVEKMFEVRSDALQKIRETEDQVGRSREERMKNVRGCFAVGNVATVRDRHVIVFDDILTTGATLADAQRALNEAGAKNVISATIAR